MDINKIDSSKFEFKKSGSHSTTKTQTGEAAFDKFKSLSKESGVDTLDINVDSVKNIVTPYLAGSGFVAQGISSGNDALTNVNNAISTWGEDKENIRNTNTWNDLSTTGNAAKQEGMHLSNDVKNSSASLSEAKSFVNSFAETTNEEKTQADEEFSEASENLETTVETNELNIANQQENVDTAQNNYDTADAQLTEQTNNLENNLENATENRENIEEQANQVTENREATEEKSEVADDNVETAQDNVEHAESEISTAESEVSTAESEVSTAESAVSQAESAEASLSSELSAAESNESEAEGENKSGFQKMVSSIKAKLQEASDKIEQAKVKKEQAEQKLEQANKKKEQAEQKVETAKDSEQEAIEQQKDAHALEDKAVEQENEILQNKEDAIKDEEIATEQLEVQKQQAEDTRAELKEEVETQEKTLEQVQKEAIRNFLDAHNLKNISEDKVYEAAQKLLKSDKVRDFLNGVADNIDKENMQASDLVQKLYERGDKALFLHDNWNNNSGINVISGSGSGSSKNYSADERLYAMAKGLDSIRNTGDVSKKAPASVKSFGSIGGAQTNSADDKNMHITLRR